MITEIRLDKRGTKYWWISLIVGIMGIITGVCCFATPLSSLVVLTDFFVAMLIVGGIFNIVSAVINRKWSSEWGWDLARGILEVMLGIWLFMQPVPLVATTMVYIIGFWMMFHSVIGICESCELSNIPVKGWGWLLACNILSLLCSFIFLVTPIFGGLFALFYIGISFILYGIFRIVLAIRLWKLNKNQ